MRSVIENQEPDDLTGQAGWVYTDLMLALMVVFLATISFVPQFMGTNSKNPSKNFSYSKVLDDSLNLIYDNFDLNLIKRDVATFKSSHGIPESADIVFVQYVGGYQAGSETAATAIARALAFSQKVDRSDPLFLKNAATTLSSSNVLSPQQVIVRFTFAVTTKINK